MKRRTLEEAMRLHMGRARPVAAPLRGLADFARTRMTRGRGLVARILALCAMGRVRTMRVRVGARDVLVDTGERFQAMMATGVYERDVPEIFARLLGPGDVYVDVGAHVGYLAAHAAQCMQERGHMVLLEPDPRALALLRAGLGAGFAAADAGPLTCAIHGEAASHRAGELPFLLHPRVGWSQLAGEYVMKHASRIPRGELCIVPCVRLDEAVALPPGASVRLLKMDVEGHEFQALEGAREWLEAGRVEAVMVEKNDPSLQHWGLDGRHLAAVLMHYGFAVAHMRSEWLDLTDTARMTQESVENFLCARDPELLMQALPNLRAQPRAAAPPEALVAEFVAEGRDPQHPNLEAQRLVARARDSRSGEELDAAISAAQEFMRLHPTLPGLRGHVAHWLMGRRRYEEARELYAQMLRDDPGDAAVAAALRRCEKKRR